NGLATAPERRAANLRQLAEKKDAVVREAHLAWPQRSSAAGETGGRDRVMRRAERTPRQKSAARRQGSGDRMNLRRHDRLIQRQPRQNGSEAFGEHRLSGARRA